MVTASRDDIVVEGAQITMNDLLAHAAAQAESDPELAAKARAEVAEQTAALKMAMDDRLGSNRAAIMNELEEKQDALRAAYDQMTPQQKIVGKLVGKLLASTGNEDIENAFTWAEVEFGEPISVRERCLALFQAAETLDMNEQTYRGIRKIFNLMNKKD